MQIGDSFVVRKTVTEAVTAAAAGSGGLQVFGTPYMIAMMENAAYSCMQRSLPEGKGSVGTKVIPADTLASMRVAIEWPRLVSIRITPLAPRAP